MGESKISKPLAAVKLVMQLWRCWIDTSQRVIQEPYSLILDMDSSESPVHGEQEGS